MVLSSPYNPMPGEMHLKGQQKQEEADGTTQEGQSASSTAGLSVELKSKL